MVSATPRSPPGGFMNDTVRDDALSGGLDRRKVLRFGLGLGGAALLAACGEGNGIGGSATPTASTAGQPAAPAVANAAAAKKYSGSTVATDIPGFGTELATTEQLAKQFEAETGVKIKTIPLPKS